jgi:hypothetical protein
VSVEFGSNVPWLDNWPIYRQLWQFSSTRNPGEELDLSVTLNRALTAQWRDSEGDVVFASVETATAPLISISQAKRGVVVIKPTGALWDTLKQGEVYSLEVIAYGVLHSATEFRIALPQPTEECLNGMSVYGSPRQILELLGMIPGASVQVTRTLAPEWVLDARGYWTADTNEIGTLFGFWIDDHFVPRVDYKDLALGSTRAFAIAGSTFYYKGPELLPDRHCETAFSRYVLRCLEEATAEVERRTGRKFGLWRYYREVHRGLARQRQIKTRQWPLVVDEFFRMDTLTYSRSLFRRYTEDNFTPDGIYGGNQLLHADAPTGVITVNPNAWDFWDFGYAVGGQIPEGLFAGIGKGENNVEITYTAGNAKVIPTDVDEACSNLAAVRQGIFWQQALTQGMQGISIGCVNMNFGSLFAQYTPQWQGSAYQICDAYTRHDIEVL